MTATDREAYTAVVDRFEDEEAVLVVERGDDPEELPVPTALLPADARRADAVLRLTVEADALRVDYLPEETDARRERARDRFEKLARRPPDVADSEPPRESESTSASEAGSDSDAERDSDPDTGSDVEQRSDSDANDGSASEIDGPES